MLNAVAMDEQLDITRRWKCQKYKTPLKDASCVILLLAYSVYYTYSLYYDFSKNPTLLILTAAGIAIMLLFLLKTQFYDDLRSTFLQKEILVSVLKKSKFFLGRFLAPMVLIGFVIFVIIDARHRPSRLISGAGLLVIIILAFLLSAHPTKIRWRCVLNGLAVQMMLGLVILRWDAGYSAISWVGKQVAAFLSYSDVGAEFVFGKSFRDHSTAMQSMPVAIYFGAVSSILYYYGVLQIAIQGIGRVIQTVMGTGAIESFVAASNIFLGPTESVLTVAPFLSKMTKAELHSVLCCGFSTISGAVLAIYISFGVPPSHLLTASVMSAPAALALSRVLLPEVEISCVANADKIVFEKPQEKNLIEAASRGASGCVRVVGYILVNLLSFTAVVQFLNMTLSWFGERAGTKGITFQRLCGFILWPLAFLLGVEWQDCGQVGELIASAIILNSFFSFIDLGKLINNRQNGLSPSISKRSEAIVIYAVCNFANFGSIGMNLGSMGALAPDKRADLANVALRALVGGNMASFMTACISGLILDH